MHRQCHFGKVKLTSCSNVDTAELRLRYVMLYSRQEVLDNDNGLIA